MLAAAEDRADLVELFHQPFEGAAGRTGVSPVVPSQRDETYRDGAQKTSFVEAVGHLRHRVFVHGELDALEQMRGSVERGAGSVVPQFGDKGFADRIRKAAVVVGVLHNGILS